MNMLLTFIIPLYNCEKYIVRCLNSIYSCGLGESDFEVVVVNDGSEDRSMEIVAEFARTKNNLTLLNFKNRGTATARNEGLNVAKGEWIWFVDADDMVQQDSLPRILMLIDDNVVDVLCFNHSILDRNGTVERILFSYRAVLSGFDYLKLHTSMYLWDKLFKRSVIGDVRFVDGIRNTEDMLFTLQVMMKAKSVSVNIENIYIYNQINSNSTLSDRKLSNLVRNSNDTYTVNERLLSLVNEERDDECRNELKERLNFGVTGHLYSLFNDRLPSCYIKEMVMKYKSLDVYPVKRSYNKKGNVFNILANKEWLLIFIVDCMRLIMKGRFVDDAKC